MTDPIKVSDNCWKHTNLKGDVFYHKNFNKESDLHREDGPAIIYKNNTKVWYINGRCHREDGPAIEYADGYKEWWINGKLHRIDGPAVECSDGKKEWWYDGKFAGVRSQKDFELYLKNLIFI